MKEEEMRSAWQEAGNRLAGPSPEEYERRRLDRQETALESLALKYRRFSRFALVFMVMCVFYMLPNRIIPGIERVWIALAFALYMGTCSCMDYWLYKGISSIDCYTMTVSEVVGKAMYYRRKHLQFIAILLPWVFCMIGVMLYAAGFEPAFTYGVLAGAVIGGALGYRKYLEFMDEYKKIKG